jgi:hypothetical protein
MKRTGTSALELRPGRMTTAACRVRDGLERLLHCQIEPVRALLSDADVETEIRIRALVE